MRIDVVNTVAPSGSPEESPAMSFAAALFSSPVCLADKRGPFVSLRRGGGSQPGPRRVSGPLAPRLGPRLCARGPP